MLFRIDLSWYFESFGCLRIWRSSRSMIARLTFVWNKQIFFIYCLFYEVILLNSRPLRVGTYYYLYRLRWDDQCLYISTVHSNHNWDQGKFKILRKSLDISIIWVVIWSKLLHFSDEIWQFTAHPSFVFHHLKWWKFKKFFYPPSPNNDNFILSEVFIFWNVP